MALLFAFTLCAVAPLADVIAPQDYTLTDLGALSVNLPSWSGDINNRGQICGTSGSPAPSGSQAFHAIFFDGTGLTDIDPIKPALAFGYSIDENGHVYGQSRARQNTFHAFHWDGTQTHDVHFGTSDFSMIRSVNEAGMQMGLFLEPNPNGGIANYHTFFRYGAIEQDIGHFGGGDTFSFNMNRLGDIVGSSNRVDGEVRGFLWQGGALQDLGDLGDTYSQGRDINDRGQIVGWSRATPNIYVPFLWENGVMTALPTLGQDAFTHSINNAGTITGWSQDNNGVQQATIWKNGSITDLNTLVNTNGFHLASADGINEVGEICGTGTNAAGDKRAYKLTPILLAPKLSSILPGLAGEDNYTVGLGFTPHGRVALVYGLASGQVDIPGCLGLQVDIHQPIVGRITTADADGRVYEVFRIAASARNLTVYLQAVDIRACAISPVTHQSLY
jgi:probable HAF family extracellular repeat protein